MAAPSASAGPAAPPGAMQVSMSAADAKSNRLAGLQAQIAAQQQKNKEAQAAQAGLAPPPAGDAKQGEEEELSAIERFCTDVTDEAKRGLLDPLVGRDEVGRRCRLERP